MKWSFGFICFSNDVIDFLKLRELNEGYSWWYNNKKSNKYFANLDKILSIEHVNGRLQLEGLEKSVPIGGSYKDDLLEKFNLL